MQNKPSSLALVRSTLLAAVLASAALRTLAYLLWYDAAVGYFRAGIVSTLLYICPIAAALALSLVWMQRLPKAAKQSELVFPATATADRAIDIVCAAALAAVSILDVIAAVSTQGIYWICAVATLLALLYNAVRLPSLALRTLCGMAWVARVLLIVCIDYFDWSTTLNSPVKIFNQLSLLVGALFVIEHVRLVRGECTARKLLILATATAIFSITNGLSGVIATALAVTTGATIATFLLSLAIGIRACFTVFTLLSAKHEPAVDTAEPTPEQTQTSNPQG